jgi:hypothetical protein
MILQYYHTEIHTHHTFGFGMLHTYSKFVWLFTSQDLPVVMINMAWMWKVYALEHLHINQFNWAWNLCINLFSGNQCHYTLISGFRRDFDEICGFLGCYVASCGNCLPTFQDNVSVPSSLVKSPSPETSVNNYHMTPRSTPEDCRFQCH